MDQRPLKVYVHTPGRERRGGREEERREGRREERREG
jgi:hypothetical protein